MEIKNMTYSSVSGGTFTVGVNENGKIKHKEQDVPSTLTELIVALETRLGEPVDGITFQICPSQHLSEERIIINYKIDKETFMASKTILNISDMSFYEKARYNALIEQLNS